MSALTSHRDTREILCGCPNYSRKIEIASGSTIYTGSIAAVNSSGKAVAASDASGIAVAGICEGTSDGYACVRSGVFVLDNATGNDLLAANDIGRVVFVVDDHTAGKTGGTNKIPAGRLFDVLTSGIAVEVGNGPHSADIPTTSSAE